MKSLMSVLRCPPLSVISRKRKLRANHPPTGKKRSCSRPCRGLSDPKSITPVQRLKEHPGESLSVSNGKLFCGACREELSLKANILKNHLKSEKHKEGKTKLEGKEARERDIAAALERDNETAHLEGKTLPLKQQVYRVSVLTAFLKAGMPLSKLSHLPEKNGLRLTDRSHMANQIPFVLEDEKIRLKQELGTRDMSVVFDGTTRLGEVLVVVLRFLDSDWTIQQRLVRVKTLAKSMQGEEIALELICTA